MGKIIDTLIGNVEQKKEWNALEKRSKALQGDYKVVYGTIKEYLFNFGTTDSVDMLSLFSAVLDMFETAAAEGKDVLALVGNDVMAFCDGLLNSVTSKTWVDIKRAKMNADLHRKLGR